MADLTINTSVDANLIESLQYSAPVSSKLINTNSYKVKDAGIYYGGFLTDGNTKITPFVAEVPDVNGLSYQIHIETKTSLTIPTWGNNQSLYLSWTWNASNIAHVVLQTGSTSLTSNTVCIASKDSGGNINYTQRVVPMAVANRAQLVNTNTVGVFSTNQIALPDCSIRLNTGGITRRDFKVVNWSYSGGASAGVEIGYDYDGNVVMDNESKKVPYVLGSVITDSSSNITGLAYKGTLPAKQVVAINGGSQTIQLSTTYTERRGTNDYDYADIAMNNIPLNACVILETWSGNYATPTSYAKTAISALGYRTHASEGHSWWANSWFLKRNSAGVVRVYWRICGRRMGINGMLFPSYGNWRISLEWNGNGPTI